MNTKLLWIAPLALLLSGCPLDAVTGGGAGATAAPAAAGNGSAMNLPGFLTRLEAVRGTALTAAEKSQVSTAAQATRGMIDSTQQRFLNSAGQAVGLDGATLGLLFPKAAQPLSQSEFLSKLETQAGRRLGGAETQAAKAALALRNNSLASLKSGLAGKVGGIVGLDGPTVEALLPLLGF